jgi:hypothetical protein
MGKGEIMADSTSPHGPRHMRACRGRLAQRHEPGQVRSKGHAQYVRPVSELSARVRSCIDLIDVRFGSLADVTLMNCDVCFTPESGH